MQKLLFVLFMCWCVSPTFAQIELGLAKQDSAPINNLDGSFSTTITYTVKNYGILPISNLQVTDDLAGQFAPGAILNLTGLNSPSGFLTDPSFNGAGQPNLLLPGNSLAPGMSAIINLTVRIKPQEDAFYNYANNANATGMYGSGMPVADVSQTGLNPDANNNGNPLDDAQPTVTSMQVFGAPNIALSFYPAATTYNGGNSYDVSLIVNSNNLGGNSDLTSAITIDLGAAFPAPASVSVLSVAPLSGNAVVGDLNPGFNGISDQNLFVPGNILQAGENSSYTLRLRMDTGGGTWFFAGANGTNVLGSTLPGSPVATYHPIGGSSPVAGAPASPAGRPAAIILTQAVKVGTSFDVQSVTQNALGDYTVRFQYHVKAYGSGQATNVQTRLHLNAFMNKCWNYSLTSITPITPFPSTMTLNPAFTGFANSYVTPGPTVTFATGSLNGGEEGVYEMVFRITGAAAAPLSIVYTQAENDALGGAIRVTDTGVNGNDPDPDHDGDPANNEGTWIAMPASSDPPQIQSSLSVNDLNGGTVQPGDILEFTHLITNTGGPTANGMVGTITLDPRFTYVPNSIILGNVPGNVGGRTDTVGDDTAQYAGGVITVYAGQGAVAGTGGTIIGIGYADWATQQIKYRVQVNNTVNPGDVIPSQWTASFGPGTNSVLSSNIGDPHTLFGCPNFDHQPTPVMIGPRPTISVTKAMTDANGGTVVPGDILHVTLTARNTSATDGAANAAIEDTIQANLSYVAGSLKINGASVTETLADDAGYYLSGSQLVHANIGPGSSAVSGGVLAPGATQVVEFNVQINPATTPGTLVNNTAYLNTVYGSAASIDQASGSVRVTSITVVAPPQPNLQKTVVDDNGGSLMPGDTMTWTLTLAANPTGGPVTDAMITDNLAAVTNATYVAGSLKINGVAKTDAAGDDQADVVGNALTARVGTGATATVGGGLLPGEFATITFQTRVNAGVAPGTIIPNQGSVTYNNLGTPLLSSPVVGAPPAPTTITTGGSYGAPLIGPNGAAAATGPTDNNDDFTDQSLSTGIAGVAFGGNTTASGTLVFTNTLQNTGSIADSYTLSTPTVPTGFAVRVSVDNGATWTTTSGGATVTTLSVAAGGTQQVLVEVTAPSGIAVLTPYNTILRATSTGDNTKSNQTIDRTFTGFVKVLKSTVTINATGIGGTTTPVSSADMDYTISYQNLSQAAGTGSVALAAINFILVEDGDLGSNNWAVFTTHVPGQESDSRGGVIVLSPSTGGVANGKYTDTVGTLAAGQSGSFKFRRRIK